MTFSWKDDVLACAGPLTVDDAEALLQELAQQSSTGGAPCADLSGCGQVHAACLQVLMAAGVRVVAWPLDATLGAWLRAALPAALPTPACSPIKT